MTKEFKEVRKDYHGPEASTFVQFGRKLLGELKDRMKIGDLQQLTHTEDLPDGGRITVSSVFGQDTIRITRPEPVEVKKPEEEEPRTKPYMWIGARIMYEKTTNVPYGQFGLVVSEPGHAGIVCGANNSWCEDYFLGLFDKQNVNAVDIAAQNNLLAANFSWVQPERYQYCAVDQVTDGVTYNRFNEQRFTKNLLRHYDIYSNGGDSDEGLLIKRPYDPQAKPEDAAKRVFPSDYPDQWRNQLWDQVVVLDPDEGGDDPTSDRTEDKQVLDLLSKATGVPADDSMVLSGEYCVKVVVQATDCNWSNVAAPYNYGWNEDRTEYYDAVPIEIEVRLGKEPNTDTTIYQIEVPRGSEYYKNLWPFGDPLNGSDCGHAGGINHHYNCWWQGALLIDVESSSIRQVDNYIPDYFGANDWGTDPFVGCNRTSWGIYCTLYTPFYGYSFPATPDAIGTQVYNLLVTARTGAFGQVSIPSTTEAEIQAAARATIADEKLYRYDVDTKTFKLVPDAVADPNPGNPGFYPWDNYYRIYELQHGRTYGRIIMGLDYNFDGYQKSGDPDFDYCNPLP